MEKLKSIFSRENLEELLDILKIPFVEWNGSLTLGKTESGLLSNDELLKISETFCFIGSDGTTAKVAKNEPDSPTYISAGLIMWGIDNNETKTYEFNQRLVIDHTKILSHSTIRTILEIRTALCILISRKFKSRRCANCPFDQSGCQWQNDSFKPWQYFTDKRLVAILDLPVIFTFIKTMPTLDSDNRDYLLTNIRKSFEDIRKYELPVIFVSQKSTLKNVIKDLASELDEAINSIDNRAKSLLELITESQEVELTSNSLPILVEIRNQMKNKFFSDYDLLEKWLEGIATPSPVFNVKPSEYNNDWGDLKFHYLTWGYQEFYNNEWIYFPSSWLRIGYSPALTSVEAHKIFCIDMILGKGHSISLTMAHTACNMYKRSYTSVLIDFYNKDRPEKYKLGKNIKNMNKWRFIKK
ncbi:hypothetical protein LCGC14_0988420 [marine sediment metagenome]|uniref:NurA domain-containing protein n=1 Tax=marine sediment metagenome TaxID=412755 RepID=A0A0F9NT63_9ZZZZ